MLSFFVPRCTCLCKHYIVKYRKAITTLAIASTRTMNFFIVLRQK